MRESKKIILIIFGLLLILNQGFAQNIKVTGTVVDDLNEAIIGTTVKIKGTSIGVITNFEGKFSIDVPASNPILEISYIGMKPQILKINDRAKDLIIKMQPDNKLLDEVVVVGYGTQKKINATGAVKTLDAKVLDSRPISNAMQGLQGTIAGLNITNDNGGALGQEMQINIRGLGSIGENTTSSPLVLIDGIEGSLSSINPNDIESFSVLKDGASASIYGSRAPFGVILVTTKKGKEGAMHVKYSGNIRLSNPIYVPNPLDSYKYALAVNDAYTNSGKTPPFGSSQIDKILKFQQGFYTTGNEKYGMAYYTVNKPTGVELDWVGQQESFANTNWYDVMIKDITTSQEHNINLSGGSKTANYFISSNFLDQKGLFNFANEKYQRFTLNGKLDLKITDKLLLSWNTRFINTDNNRPTAMVGLGNLFYHNLGRRYPLVPLVMPNGEYHKNSMIPALQDGGRDDARNQTIYNQAQFVYEPLKNWKVYLDLGSRIENSNQSRQFKKIDWTQPDGRIEYIEIFEGIGERNDVNSDGTFRRWPRAGDTFYERAFGTISFFTTSFRTDYELNLNKHHFKFLIGSQTEFFHTEMIRVGSDNVLIDDVPFLPSGAGTNPRMSEKKGEWSNLGLFGRINYNYADRYMLEVNLRADGASRFPTDQRWGVFPSASAGWNVAEENFFKNLKHAGFDMLKLRGSYSLLGNQNTNSFYPYYQYMSSNTSSFVFNGATSNVLPAPQPFSTFLTWEKIENYGAGLDLAFLNNRLAMAFDIYQRTTKDMVGPAQQLPAIYGANVPVTNNAELRTRGWEVELTWRDKINKDLSYNVNFTLSDFQSVVTKYNSPDKALRGYYEGKILGDIWGYQTIGIAKSDKEMAEYLAVNSQSDLGQNWGGGDLMYKNLDANPRINSGASTLTDHGDLSVIGNTTPRYSFGANIGFKYKMFDLSMFFQGIGKRELFIDGATFFGVASEWQRSLFVDHLDYFRFAGEPLGANSDAYYPRMRIDANNHYASDHYIQNAAYIRMKNLQVGVNLPINTNKNKLVKGARLYLSGENLFTFSKLRIFDPEGALGGSNNEMGSGKTYPMYRVFSAGVEINL